MANQTHEKSVDEIKEYLLAFEEIVSDYVGNEVSFPIESISETGEISIGFNLIGSVNYPYIEEFGYHLAEILVNLMEESINKVECLDWEIFYKLKLKLSLSFIFGNANDTRLNFKRFKFLNDLIEISSLTYESVPANIGILYCEESNVNALSQQFNIDIIHLQNNCNIRQFFKTEKPLIRLVDGESIDLLVNNDFEVYGIIRSKEDKTDLSKQFIKQFEKLKIKKNLTAVKEFITKRQEDFIAKGDDICKAVIGFIKEKFSNADFNINCTRPEFIYFRAENATLYVYNEEDFVTTFENGDWKLKNFYLLQYIILQYSLLRKYIYIGHDESEVLENALKSIDTLIENITFLSKSKTSSIIVIVPNNEQLSYSLTGEEAIKLLEAAPLKKTESEKLYIELIKRDGRHLNINEVNSKFLANLCAIDGALVLDDTFNLLSFGEIIDVPAQKHDGNIYGTGTNACKVASKNGLAIKISEDGDIKVYSMEKNLLTI